MNSFEHNRHGSLIFASITFILRTSDINFVDIPRYSKDKYKEMMGDLVKYEDYVTEVSVTKAIRGGKLPHRVYQVIIMEPDAMTLDEIKKMEQVKKANIPQQPVGPKKEKPSYDETPDVGVPKK